MVKSNQQVIEAYEKTFCMEGADKMKFDDILKEEEKKLSFQREERKKENSSAAFPRSYTENIARYRTSPYITKIADMNVFKK